MQAMILAAGLGTRLRPLTDERPKALVEVGGKPLLEHLILKLRSNGFDRIIVNVHHFGEQIIDFLQANQNFGADIRISDERKLLLNTGGGISHALQYARQDEPLLIHNVDIACDINLADLYSDARDQQGKADAILVVNEQPTKRYLLFNHSGQLRGWQNVTDNGCTGVNKGEEPIEQLQRRHFTGIHVIMPTLFDSLSKYADGPFSIIDYYLSVCTSANLQAWTLPAAMRWVDCGRIEFLKQAAEIL